MLTMENNLLLDEKASEMIGLLNNKFKDDGQSFSCHLEGMLHAGYVTYWNYTQLNILLNIQHPRTGIPDEVIFIGYHQITELYFKLVLWEMQQLSEARVAHDVFLEKVRRINRYVDNLVYSFDIMVDGLDKSQFLLFRTALSPASGFQSVQYRQIEIGATDLINLLPERLREGKRGADVENIYSSIYWKEGALDIATGRKDLSLVNFEKHYDKLLLDEAGTYSNTNLLRKYEQIPDDEPLKMAIRSELRRFDNLLNVKWRLSHFRTAARHLKRDNQAVRATGGTNWMKYLPPKYQRIIFFPDLWDAEETEKWGSTFLEEIMQ
jgi:tryptophan 2,3-dioxygenase